MSAINRFHEVANDALVKISNQLTAEAKLSLVIYTPGEPEQDILLKEPGVDTDEVLNTIRRRGGLSLDGDNAYKRGICDVAVGAMAAGKQSINQPPEGHWGQRFWDIGRAERALQEELIQALRLVRKELDACQRVIHYAGGFDPAYVDDAQVALKATDAVLAKSPL